MKNPFSHLFRARTSQQASIASGCRLRRAGLLLRAKPVGEIRHPNLSHPGFRGLRLRAGYRRNRPLACPCMSMRRPTQAAARPMSIRSTRLLHDEPNTEMTSFVWRETMLSHLLLYGNSYCQIIRSGRSKIVGLYPLLPDRMTVDRDSKGKLTYTYTTSDGKTAHLAPEDVLHIPGLGFDGVMGYSPIALEKAAIGLGIAAEEYGSKFFANGARAFGHPHASQHGQGPRGPACQLERGLWRLGKCQPW